ncbi:FHA domain-containing protein [Thalassotalea sp. PLHSN55]|uniref:FHA domain-containing protein n=1 Tax=Thalassotalea sp. PLHSN55 TaxID=3435888 RepID=UPI003F83E45A
MATLLNKHNQQSSLLQSHHSFGRLQCSVNTNISDPYISKVHAFIEWNGEHWLLRDVSSNGTWLNGNKLAREQIAHLKKDDVITFASKSANAFQVLDINPPCDCLIPIAHNSKAIELEYFHLLPSKEAQPMVLSFNNQTYSWWQEILDDNLSQSVTSAELSDQEILTVDGLSWQLQINRAVADTQILRPTVTSLDDIRFTFNTSLDEESTQLFMQTGGENIDLLVRSHHYLTLTLARQRAADMQAGLSDSEQGWLYAEHLVKDLGMDASHLNIQIYRIRKQFVDALNNNCESSDIIERKAGKLRLASKNFCVIKGDVTECDTSQTIHVEPSQEAKEYSQLN